MKRFWNHVGLKRVLGYTPVHAVLTFVEVSAYEHRWDWFSAHSAQSLTPLLWAVLAQTGVSLAVAPYTEPRWPRAGRVAALVAGQVAIPLMLFGSYLLARLGTH